MTLPNPLPANYGTGQQFTAGEENADEIAINEDTVAIAALQATSGVYSTISILRAANVSANVVRVLGYYAPGDGGGGLFRWDATEHTSTDNGGMTIVPSNSLSTQGRWKRVYEGWVNARWFGVNPSQNDNTQALQNAVTWVGTQAYPNNGGVVYIPEGWYYFLFDQGTSGLATITNPNDDVLICGEGRATFLVVANHAYPSELAYFFTFSSGTNNHGQGGGVRDLCFYGQSMLKWGIFLDTWHGATFENLYSLDVHSGILDACTTSTTMFGEGILCRHFDLEASAGTTISQYGVRFRPGGTSSKIWTDSWIEDVFGGSVWDSGVYLDGCQRFKVNGVIVSNNGTSSDSIDGASHSGVLHAVHITNNIANASTASTGFHRIDNIYHESLSGSESPSTNIAVYIHTPTGQAVAGGHNKCNRVSNVAVNAATGSNAVAFFGLADDNGFGLTHDNTFVGNAQLITQSNTIQIGSSVTNTYLDLTPKFLVTNAPGATPTIDTNLYQQVSFTGLAVAITSLTTNLLGTPNDGQPLRLRFKDNGTARAITHGASFVSTGNGTLLTTTVANKTHTEDFIWDAAKAAWACVRADSTGY